MDHNTYVETIKQFIVYPPEREKEYLECLLFSEVGEVVGVHAKYVRGDFDEAEYKKRLIGELGDVLFAASLLLGDMTTTGLFIRRSWVDFVYDAYLIYDSYFGEEDIESVRDYIAYMLLRWLSIPGITIEQLREANVAKLKSRMERGKIKGDGSER